jgi:hypothetical protein
MPANHMKETVPTTTYTLFILTTEVQQNILVPRSTYTHKDAGDFLSLNRFYNMNKNQTILA